MTKAKSELSQQRALLLKGLDAQQQEAVLDQAAQLLVVAGAGSGKTRVFVHRIARLVLDGTPPSSILALSYTNAAANEVKARLAAMGIEGVQTSTMHAWCHREPLRRFGHVIGKGDYEILDAEGQEETLVYDMHLGEWGAKHLQAELTVAKNFVTSHIQQEIEHAAAHVRADSSGMRVEQYNKILARRGQLDFDDLQVHALQVLQQVPQALLHYRSSLRAVLVDEYQDVNPIQHELLAMLCGPPGAAAPGGLPTPELCVVGDPRQSIFAFRGSDPSFIKNFEKEFPASSTVVLSRNYRSTQRILDSADAIVSANPDDVSVAGRMSTRAGRGRAVRVRKYADERDEARQVAAHVSRLIEGEGIEPAGVGVLYRMHKQGDVLVEELNKAGVPTWLAQGGENEDSTLGVHVRSIHSAKGLEYEAVVLVGWHEGSMPIWRVREESDPDVRAAMMGEERRIAYVAVTRGKRNVLITYPARTATGKGVRRVNKPSRFIDVVLGEGMVSESDPYQGF